MCKIPYFGIIAQFVILILCSCKSNTQQHCDYQPTDLRKLTYDEQLDRILNSGGKFYRGGIYFDTCGNLLSPEYVDSVFQMYEMGYTLDFFVNDSNEIQQAIFRISTKRDSQFFNRVNLESNRIHRVEPYVVDCHRIRALLDDALEKDQSNRGNGRTIDQELDRRNLETVISIIEHCGFPTKETVGKDGMLTVFLVLQHSDYHHMKKYYPYLKSGALNSDLEMSTLVLMQDRILMMEGKPQIYGTQIVNGKLYDLEDPARVNERRASVGLGPIEGYLKRFGIDYEPEKATSAN